MSQNLVPTTSVDNSGLLNESASSSNLHQSVDEAPTGNDSDYYENTSPTAGIVVHKLSNGADPGIHTNHVIRIRGMVTSGTATIDVTIYAGYPLTGSAPGNGNMVANVTFNSLAGSPGGHSYTLTQTEAGYITDYTTLYAKVSLAGSGKGGAGAARLHQFYFDIPDAPGGNDPSRFLLMF